MSVKILIVDDEADLLEAYREMLESSGFEVTATALNGEEAVKKFADFKTRPDIVIMDHRMPVMNGLDAVREILKIDPSAKIVFLSADYSIEKEALRAGAFSFSAKPMALNALVDNLRQIRS